MTWTIKFYKGVDEQLLAMPPKIQARMIRLLELMEVYGANLGEPHTSVIGGGLFEIRAKAQEGIGRAIFCYEVDRQVYILHIFIKKAQKLSKKDREIAKQRMKKVML